MWQTIVLILLVILCGVLLILLVRHALHKRTQRRDSQYCNDPEGGRGFDHILGASPVENESIDPPQLSLNGDPLAVQSPNYDSIDPHPSIEASTMGSHTNCDSLTPSQRLCLWAHWQNLIQTNFWEEGHGLSCLQLIDYHPNMVDTDDLPPGLVGSVVDLLSFLTLTYIPEQQVISFWSRGVDRSSSNTHTPYKYNISCMVATQQDNDKPVVIPHFVDRMNRHIAVGQMFDSHCLLLKVLSVFEDVIDDQNTPAGCPKDVIGCPANVVITHSYTYTLTDEIDRRTRIRLAHLKAKGANLEEMEPEDYDPLFGQDALAYYLMQICSALQYLGNCNVKASVATMTPDTIFLQHNPENPQKPSVRIGIFAGKTPSNLLHLSPYTLAAQSVGTRLNIEGRSGGLAYVVDCMLGGVDPIQYRQDDQYTVQFTRLLGMMIDEEITSNSSISLQHFINYLVTANFGSGAPDLSMTTEDLFRRGSGPGSPTSSRLGVSHDQRISILSEATYNSSRRSEVESIRSTSLASIQLSPHRGGSSSQFQLDRMEREPDSFGAPGPQRPKSRSVSSAADQEGALTPGGVRLKIKMTNAVPHVDESQDELDTIRSEASAVPLFQSVEEKKD